MGALDFLKKLPARRSDSQLPAKPVRCVPAPVAVAELPVDARGKAAERLRFVRLVEITKATAASPTPTPVSSSQSIMRSSFRSCAAPDTAGPRSSPTTTSATGAPPSVREAVTTRSCAASPTATPEAFKRRAATLGSGNIFMRFTQFKPASDLGRISATRRRKCARSIRLSASRLWHRRVTGSRSSIRPS